MLPLLICLNSNMIIFLSGPIKSDRPNHDGTFIWGCYSSSNSWTWLPFEASFFKVYKYQNCNSTLPHPYAATFYVIPNMFSFPAFRFGVILDPWMFSLKEELNLPSTVKQPLLFINTETFHIAPNFHAVKKYTDTTSDGCGKRTVFTIRCVYRH